jgi:hypothetical protein
MPAETAALFTSRAWNIVNPEAASLSTQAYAQFIQASAGEFTVAKEIYSGLPSGWFSDRSAAYLASGRPVVTQATGFNRWLPTGEGLFSFSTLDQAADALNAIASDYPGHSAGARRVAQQSFESSKVLNDLIERIL